MDYADCNWIVQLYLDCTIVTGLYDCIWIVQLYLDCTILLGLYNCRICITYTPPPPLCQKVVPNIIVSIVVGICWLYLDYVNCIWIVSIVFGFCDFIWIVWLYLDCTIVFWLCRLYLDCTGFGKGGVILPLPPPLCRKSFTKKGLHVYMNVAKVILGLWEATLNYVDCRLHVNCMSIVLIVFELCRSQGFRKTLKWIISINILPILEKGAMLCFHTSDTDTIVGLDLS